MLGLEQSLYRSDRRACINLLIVQTMGRLVPISPIHPSIQHDIPLPSLNYPAPNHVFLAKSST